MGAPYGTPLLALAAKFKTRVEVTNVVAYNTALIINAITNFYEHGLRLPKSSPLRDSALSHVHKYNTKVEVFGNDKCTSLQHCSIYSCCNNFLEERLEPTQKYSLT